MPDETTKPSKQTTTLTGRGFTPPSPINRQAAVRSGGGAARAAKRTEIGDVDDGGTFTIEAKKSKRRHLVAYVVEGGLLHVTVWLDGQWRTKAPTQCDAGLLAKALSRTVASEILRENGTH